VALAAQRKGAAVSHDHHHDHHHDHDHHDDGGVRPSLGALFTNFRTYDAPFHVKLRLALRNNMIKFRTHSNCCGHLGEPGC